MLLSTLFTKVTEPSPVKPLASYAKSRITPTPFLFAPKSRGYIEVIVINKNNEPLNLEVVNRVPYAVVPSSLYPTDRDLYFRVRFPRPHS